MNTERVELLGDYKFVIDRCGNAFNLKTIAQRGVKNFDTLGTR